MPVRPRRAGAMLLGVLLAVVGSLVAAAPAQEIYKGHDADFGEYRLMVSLRLATTPDNPRCGGTLPSAARVPRSEVIPPRGQRSPVDQDAFLGPMLRMSIGASVPCRSTRRQRGS